MIYTSDSLIEAIKRNGSFPTSQRRFTTGDFLKFLNEENELTITTLLTSMNQDYFVEHETTSLVANQSEYNFPLRAVSWKANSVGYLDSLNTYTRLPKISRSQRGNYGTSSNSFPGAFYVEGTKIVLIPSIGASPTGSIQVDFVRLQNELIQVSACGLITVVVVVGVNYQITVNSVPATAAGVDIISGTNPFNIIARGSAPVVAGFNLTIPMADFERAPVVGDYVAPFGYTPIPNIPEDIHPVLAQAATIRCLISMTDAKGIQTAQISFDRMVKALTTRTAERVESSVTKIVPSSRLLNRMR